MDQTNYVTGNNKQGMKPMTPGTEALVLGRAQ